MLSGFWDAALNQLALFRITDIIDILVVSYLIYKALKFIRDTRTIQLLKGLIIFVVLMQLSYFLKLNVLYYILSNFLQLGVIAIIIVFQPELRRALEQLGRTSMSRWFNQGGGINEEVENMVREVARGAQALSNDSIGALVVIEKDDKLDALISSGIKINAEVSSELLVNIFIPNTPLHDGAVVIRDNRVEFATCVLPLSENPNIRQELGTRHRAGIGISEESDAVVVIVSEETGNISVANSGILKTGFNEDSLRKRLISLLKRETVQETKKRLKLFGGGGKQ